MTKLLAQGRGLKVFCNQFGPRLPKVRVQLADRPSWLIAQIYQQMLDVNKTTVLMGWGATRDRDFRKENNHSDGAYACTKDWKNWLTPCKIGVPNSTAVCQKFVIKLLILFGRRADGLLFIDSSVTAHQAKINPIY